jgi:hypothetical protein
MPLIPDTRVCLSTHVRLPQPFLGSQPNDEWWDALYQLVMHLYIDQAVLMLEQVCMPNEPCKSALSL